MSHMNFGATLFSTVSAYYWFDKGKKGGSNMSFYGFPEVIGLCARGCVTYVWGMTNLKSLAEPL